MTESRTADLAAQARSRGAYPHIADAGANPDKASTMAAIAEALAFPGWFGHNLDALYDCLTDLSWLPAGEHVLIWVGANGLKQGEPKTYLAVHSVLSDAQRAMAPSGERSDGRLLIVELGDD